MTLVQSSALLACGSQSTHLTMFVNWVDDPIDTWVAADGLVLWVDEDDFEVLVSAVLVDPVAVEDAEIGAAAADTLFGGGFEGALVFELVHTLVRWLACGSLCQQLSVPHEGLLQLSRYIPNVAPFGTGLFLPPRLTRTDRKSVV